MKLNHLHAARVRKLPLALTLAALAAASAPLATAQDEDEGWYGGFNLGEARTNANDLTHTALNSGGNFSTQVTANDHSDFAFKVFGGYRFNRMVSFEGGYFDLGEAKFSGTTTPQGILNGTVKTEGWNLDALLRLPLSERVSAFARAGLLHAKVRTSYQGTGAAIGIGRSHTDRGENYKYGVGLQYDLTPTFALRLEGERYRMDYVAGKTGDANMYSLGFVFRFGQGTRFNRNASTGSAAPVTVAPQREVATLQSPAPSPAPVPAPPPAPAPEQVMMSFEADAMFDFDKSEVTEAGKRALDNLVTELDGADYDMITVSGYTDRIGSSDYNMALSLRRAEAVKDYLVNSAGIPAARISTRGLNGSNPVTGPDQCRGQSPVTCLQPDRRVEVTVSGMKNVQAQL